MRIDIEHVDQIVESIAEEFETYGGGKPGHGGLSSHPAMVDSSPCFAPYVDVKEVVMHVLWKLAQVTQSGGCHIDMPDDEDDEDGF